MDFIAPALVGVGLYLCYYAWRSHTNQTPPTPLADIKASISATGTKSTTNANRGVG